MVKHEKHPGTQYSFSIRTIILTTNILLVFLFTSLTFLVFYKVSSHQITTIVENNAAGTMVNIGNTLDENCYKFFQQITSLSQNRNYNKLQYNIYTNKTTLEPESYIALNNDIKNFYRHNASIIESVFLYLNDNSIMIYAGDNAIKKIQFDFDYYYKKYGADGMKWREIDSIPPYETVYPQETCLPIMQLLGTPETEIQGIFLINLKASYLEDILEKQRITNNSSLAIMQKNHYLHPDKVPPKYRLEPETIEYICSGSLLENAFFAGRTDICYVLYRPLMINGLGIMATIPMEEMYLDLAKSSTILPVAAICLTLLGVIIYLILSYKVSKPVIALTRKISQVGAGNLDTCFDIHGIREINTLNDNIGELTGSIRQLLRELNIQLENKRRAELAALQSQINPHFLYNTLYAARQLCEMDEKDNAILMIDSLATFYRIGVSKGASIIPLEEELKHVLSYLQIQQMRYEDEFNYLIDIGEPFYECRIMKLSLQPIVENAIYHGIRPKRSCGMLSISADLIQETLYIYISDDGLGMEPEKLAALQSAINDVNSPNTSRSYGLRNVHQRLTLAFGTEYGLSIESESGFGTTVTVKIPYQTSYTKHQGETT